MSAVADKTADDTTYREMVEALVLAQSVGNDGRKSPEDHADIAIRAADALLARQAQRGGA